jgi:hypothetical protein
MLPFSLCKKKRLAIQHMNRPFFPTTLSIPSYDIEKKIELRTYQHTLVQLDCVKMWKLLEQHVYNNMINMYGTNNNTVRTLQVSKELRSLQEAVLAQ